MKKYKNKHFVAKLFIALTIFATIFGTQSCSEDEVQYVKVTGITVTPNNTTLLINDTATLVATVFPRLATDRDVTWKSDNLSVVKVDDNGFVTTLAEGVAKISVTSEGNSEKTDTCVITVVSTFSVTLNATSLRIPVEANRTLIATIIPLNVTQDVTWTSDNTGAVTVDSETGVITAVASGTATITAVSTVNASRTAECTVTVVEVPAGIPAVKDLIGMWTFEDEDHAKATVGNDLEATGAFTAVDGPGNTGAIKPVGGSSYYTIRHDIGANGGGEYVNEYTLMMDIRGSASEFGGWLSVYNNGSRDNTSEAQLWIDGSGQIGDADLGGYSSPVLTPDIWHRVVIAVKLGESFKIYVDGEQAFTASGNNGVDGMMSLYPDVVHIGADGTGYPGPAFADVRMWSVQLTDDEVAELGSAE
jgi:uncharacterized protein YjdB